MGQLDYLLKYVRTGTAEGDRTFLKEIFIAPSSFSDLCAIEPGGMRLLVGDKGIGKSALVEWIYKVTTSKGLPSLLIRPDDIVSKDIPSGSDIASLKRFYYDVILRTVAARIGSKLKGLLTGDAARLYSEARVSGLAEDDFVQKTLELLTAISVPVSKVNGVQLARDLAGSNSHNALAGAINTHLLSSGSIFFLMIDDTDQLAAPDQTSHLNRLWGLLLAIRRFVGECPAIRPIVTLRTGVWTRLTTESMGQRDQTDHLRNYVIPLVSDERQIEEIIRKRLLCAAYDASQKGNPYSVFFEGDEVILPSSTQHRKWDSFITKSSRDRPRDAIQLIKKMIDCAGATARIDSVAAAKAMTIYSSERVDDVVNEFSLDCKNIREIINTFAELAFETEFETLRQHLRTIPSIGSTSVRASVMKPESDDDAVVILSLLHEAGFVNPRLKDASLPRGFRHVLFRDDPNFARMANWNQMQAAHWEVHPAFRTYLIGIQESRKQRK